MEFTFDRRLSYFNIQGRRKLFYGGGGEGGAELKCLQPRLTDGEKYLKKKTC